MMKLRRSVRYANRGMWFAVFACISMGLFAQSPSFMGTQLWVSAILYIATYGLAGVGFYWSFKAFRQRKNIWNALGIAINALIIISLFAFSFLIYKALFGINP